MTILCVYMGYTPRIVTVNPYCKLYVHQTYVHLHNLYNRTQTYVCLPVAQLYEKSTDPHVPTPF